MFKLRVKKFVLQFLSVFLIIWGAASFFVFPTLQFVQIAIVVLSVSAIILLLFKRSGYFGFIITIFTNIYALYGILFTYGLPVWSVMLLLVVIFAFCFYTNFHNLFGNHFIIYLSLFLILNLEIFLTLSYYLVNPMTRSLIMVIFSHLFYGYMTSIDEKNVLDVKNLYSYIYSASIILIFLFLTISWGR
jgi:hypothetical protein